MELRDEDISIILKQLSCRLVDLRKYQKQALEDMNAQWVFDVTGMIKEVEEVMMRLVS